MRYKTTRNLASAALLGLLCGAAAAHPGHGSTSFIHDGLLHLLEVEHLLVLLAVGLWTVLAVAAQRLLWGTFSLFGVMGLSWMFKLAGLTTPFLASAAALVLVLLVATLCHKRAVLRAALNKA